jgi:hypothetical protein
MPKADKKGGASGRERATKNLVECVLVAQRQTLTNSRANLDSISASLQVLLLPPPPNLWLPQKILKSHESLNHATVCCQTIEIAVTGGSLLARHSTRHPSTC